MFRRLLDKITGRQAYYRAGLEEGQRVEQQNRQLRKITATGGWTERWYGSGPERGWHIANCTDKDHIIYLGEGISSEKVSQIIYEHNKAVGDAELK